MAGENKTNSSEGNVPAIDMSKYVSKEDNDRLVAESKSAQDKLQQELEQAKLALLDPEYISYLESKQGKSTANKVVSEIDKLRDTVDVERLSSKELLALSVDKAVEVVQSKLMPVYEGQMRKMGQALSDVLAVLELQDVEKKYSDFGDYRDATKKMLESSSTPLTIEQAYLLAKTSSQGKDAKTPEEKAAAARTAGEKPGAGMSQDNSQPKSFANAKDAGEDAWNKVVGAGKDTL